MYSLHPITDKSVWNDFIVSHFSFYSFLDSWEWGEFQVLEGNTIFRFGIYEAEQLIGVLLLIKIRARRGTYFLAPHSPLILGDYFSVLRAIREPLRALAKAENVSFLRINGVTENTLRNLNAYREIGFIFGPIHVHAEETHLLDITLSEEELLKGMRSTTRYTINRAQKEGVEIIMENTPEMVDEFIALHRLHASRTNGKSQYHAFSPRYIRHLFVAFGREQITCMKAVYEGRTEAMLVTIAFGKTCVYYLGASDIQHPKFSPAYILQWEAIKKGRQAGCTLYNFW